jgi:hypothetical protein
MKKTLMNSRFLAHDKMVHFFMGTMFAVLITVLGVDPLLVAFLGFVLGIIVEMVDYLTSGQVSHLDALYTGLPGVLIFILTLV